MKTDSLCCDTEQQRTVTVPANIKQSSAGPPPPPRPPHLDTGFLSNAEKTFGLVLGWSGLA